MEYVVKNIEALFNCECHSKQQVMRTPQLTNPVLSMKPSLQRH